MAAAAGSPGEEPPLYQSTIRSLPLLGRGKVRDNYAVGDDRLLMVASDRLSAFDVVFDQQNPHLFPVRAENRAAFGVNDVVDPAAVRRGPANTVDRSPALNFQTHVQLPPGRSPTQLLEHAPQGHMPAAPQARQTTIGRA